MLRFQWPKFAVLLCIALVCQAWSRAWSGDIYMAPNGKDTNPGTEEAPAATLRRARDMVRELKESRETDARITVHIRGGRYFLDNTVVFGPKGSGSEKAPVIYRAYGDEHPVFSGGVRIRGWKKWKNGIYVAPASDRDFRQLYVQGRKAVRARFPNAGHYLRLVAWTDDKRIRMRSKDIPDTSVLTGTEMVVKKHWNQSRFKVASCPREGGFVYIVPSEPHRTHEWNQKYPQKKHHQVCHFENSLSFLDAPGEWHLDRKSRRVYYKPREGETMETADVIAPVLEHLIKVDGAKHIQFLGLRFEHTTWLGPDSSFFGFQSNIMAVPKYSTIPTGVLLVSCSNVRLERNIFRNMGGGAVGLGHSTSHNEFVGNVIRDIAGNGFTVFTDITRVDPTDAQLCRGDVIRDNYIGNCGTEYYGSSGIAAFYGDGLVVEHNEIYALPYNGMHLHWYQGRLMNTRIEGNHIHHVIQFCDDGGAIHMIESIPGTRIVRNYMHCVKISRFAGNHMPACVYLDNRTKGASIAENVLEDGNREIAFRQHSPRGGRNPLGKNHYRDGTLPQADVDRIKREAGPRGDFTLMKKQAYESNIWSPLKAAPKPIYKDIRYK